jgi:hypothetical protein
MSNIIEMQFFLAEREREINEKGDQSFAGEW